MFAKIWPVFHFYSRTPGSRQPSPSDEELNKNMAVAAVAGPNSGGMGGGNNVVVVENLHAHHPLINHPLTLPLPPPHPHPQHHQLSQLDSINHQFSDQMLDQNSFDQHQAALNSQQLNHQLSHQAAGLDSSNVVSFEVCVSFLWIIEFQFRMNQAFLSVDDIDLLRDGFGICLTSYNWDRWCE